MKVFTLEGPAMPLESRPILRLVPDVKAPVMLPEPITYKAPVVFTKPPGTVKAVAILKLLLLVNVPVVLIAPPEFKNIVPLRH
jgi:hypothetical protein